METKKRSLKTPEEAIIKKQKNEQREKNLWKKRKYKEERSLENC